MSIQPDINALLENYSQYIHAMACRLAPLPSAAEDIAQQVCLEFLAKSDKWDLTRDLKPLLAVMTRNVALRHWNQRTRQMSLEMGELADHIRQLAENQNLDWYGEEERAALRHCVDSLPEKSQQFLKLHYYLDVSSAEIARQMDLKSDAVRRAMFRLRQKLRKCIETTLRST